MNCFNCPKGNGKMCDGGCGLECPDCPENREESKGLKTPLLAKGLEYWKNQLSQEA